MDELGFDRRDPSLWMSVLRGYTIKPEMVDSLVKWLANNDPGGA